MQVDTLADYLSTYAETLIEKVESSSRPLHCDSARPEVKLLREPMPAQWDRIGAVVSSWKAKRYGMILSAEMGTGKTICAIVSTHLHAGSKPYRALVVCPPHLQEKWVREIKMTLPSVKCIILESYRDLLKLKGTKATGPEWVIISGNKAKMASSWIPAYTKKHSGILHCPNCHEAIERKVKSQGADVMVPASHWDLEKQQSFCPACGNAHFQWTHEFDRWPIANLVSRQARKVFGYLILDEAHEAKGERSSIGLATGKLASAIRYKLALTGTLLNGYADSVLPLCYRFFPSKIKALDVAWGDTMGFTKRYGRLETIISFKDSESYANRQSRGGGRTTTTRVRPGIVPSLYGDCLLENTVFCSLEDLNFKLPGCAEVLHPVQMDEELAENYDHIEREIKSSLRSMIAAGSKAAISILLNTLSGWPDHPYGFNSVGYFNSVGQWVHVTEPPELDQGTLRNKERKLLELVKDSVARGRQVWIYVEMTVKRDIQVRLESLLKAEGLDVRVLRSSTVKASEREEWIRQNATANVVISNPALVKTGLDLFDRSGAYNFSTLIFYQTGYQLDTLRQAAARSNRIGQWLECEVHYLFYADTMQESCVSLMAQKTNAAQAIEGKLTTSGLAASIEIEASAAMALAKMLIAKNDTQRVARPSVPVASCLPGVTVPTAQILSKSEPIPLPIQSPSRPMSHSSQVQPQYVVTEARMKQWVHQANAIRQAFTTVAQGSKARQMLKQLAKCLELLAQEERLKVESAMDWGNLCQLAQTTQVPLRAVRLEPAGA